MKEKVNASEVSNQNGDEYAGRKRQLGNSFWGWVIKGAAIVLSLFHFYTAGFGSLPSIQQRSFHLALVLFLVYLCFPGSKRFSRRKMNPIDVFLAVVALASNLYVFIRFDRIAANSGILTQMDLAVAGSLRGGPAKVAILASGCMGTISGSAVANVATTGTITIPMMKKLGYTPAFSACVEAIASTGGMIMPPIMGAAAMIMAEFLGESYITIMKAAIIPAILYYFACWMVVDFEARRLNLPALKREDLPKVGEVLRKRGYLLLPIVLLVALMIAGKTPLFASFWSIIAAVVISSFNKETRLTPKKAVEALEDAGMLAVPVANTCAAVGIMVGMTGATGLGLVLGDGLIKLAGGNFYLTLIFTMLTCLLLGMGLPSTACYIVVSTIAAPALIKFGISGIPVHMFVFYFGILSVLTPPVCTASYTAAGIAGESPNKVGYMAFRLALAGFLIPYVFISSPDLLLLNATFLGVAGKLVTAVLGVIAMAAMAVGFFRTPLKIWQRVAMLVGGVCLMDGGGITDLIGIILVAGIAAMSIFSARKARSGPSQE